MKNVLKNAMKVGFAATVVGCTAVVVQPQEAQAGILAGSQIDFIGRASATPGNVDFDRLIASLPFTNNWVAALNATGDFAPITSGGFTLAGLASRVGYIQDIAVPLAGPVTDWLTFGFLTFSDPNDDFKFDLTSVIDEGSSRYSLKGFVSGTPFIGDITSQLTGTGARAFSGTITAVPAPALLPSLLGVGLAAIRKRKAKTAVV